MLKLSKETIKKLIRKITHAEGTPHKIALAVSIGVFIAWFPIFGTHTALVFFLSWLLRLNPAVMLASTFVNNPFTIIPLYLSGFYVGLLFTGTAIPSSLSFDMTTDTMMELAKVFVLPFIVGNLIVGIVVAVPAYFLALRGVKSYRARKATQAITANSNDAQKEIVN